MNVNSLTLKFEGAYITNESVTDVNIQLYCDGYKELVRYFDIQISESFLTSLGSIFTFIVQDVESKIGILEALIKNDPENFLTLQSMILTEYDSLRTRNDSGCRTFLRLHRALKFLYMVFEGLMQDDDTSLKRIINNSYDDALAPYHPWMIRKGVKVAVNFLPYKEKLVESVIKSQPIENDLNTKENLQQFMQTRTIPTLKNIFICCENYYTKHSLHDLQ